MINLLVLFASSLAVCSVIYQVRFHPLRHVKGPIIASISPIFLWTICYLGIEGRVLRWYHHKYKTKVLRIAPNSVSISDSEALRQIYVTGGGFAKDDRYSNFNMGPVVTIFSAIDVAYRNRRAKAVAPLFAPARLRAASAPHGVIESCVREMLNQLNAFKKANVTVDIVDLCARCSIDVVTGYLLGERYGGLHEDIHLPIELRQRKKLSANPFVFAIVAFARFSLLPNWLFHYIYAISSWLSSSKEVSNSLMKLDQFAGRIMKNSLAVKEASSAVELNSTYQGRLLEAGIPQDEAATQAQATIFAGADSTAVMLATIFFHLVQNPLAHEKLLKEIRETKDYDVQDGSDLANGAIVSETPYLRAVIKEGLRLGMANPTRLTRVVPERGLKVEGIYLSPGTIVGCAAYMLHHDPDTFPAPFEFHPERWLEAKKENNGLHRPDMEKSMIPFGVGLRACIGKNLAQQQLYEAVRVVVDSEVLNGASTCQDRIEMTEWFNGEIKGHHLDIVWAK